MAIHWLIQRISDLPSAEFWLTVSERAVVAGFSHERRRTDWLLGRWTMKRAISALQAVSGRVPAAMAEIEIPAADDGAPEPQRQGRRIPESISLSHRSGLAVCALGPAGAELGCDLELLEPRSRAFVADFFSEEERRRCDQASGSEAVLLPNLLWSARESVLKALRVGLSVDTRRVELRLQDRLDGESWSPFEAEFRETGADRSKVFAGWWRRTAGCVVTVASRPALDAPSLLEPRGDAARLS